MNCFQYASSLFLFILIQMLMFSILFLLENEIFKWPTTLQHLDLSLNRLNNRFVSTLRDLPHLQYLDLSDNQLEGALDISGQYFL